MASAPLVSVVVPTYGRPDAVLDAVRSVREQTYDPIELVVVDDCSPDPVAPAVRDLDLERFAAVHCLRHDDNEGAASARRTGIEAATGEYLAFLDDDDEWLPEKLDRQVAAIEDAGEDAGVAYTGMRVVDETGETVRTHEPTASGDLTRTLLCRNVVGSYTNVLVRRAAIDDVGPPDPRWPCWQDLEWYLRLSVDWSFVVVSEPLSVLHQAESRDRISDDFEAISTEAYPLFVEEFGPLAAEYGRLFRRKVLGWAAFRVGGYNALRTGHWGAARRFLARAVRLYPVESTFWLYFGVSLCGRRGYDVAKRVKRAVLD